MVEEHYCEKCNTTAVFLRKKAHAVGLYCKGCGKWYKWVGKKVIKEYEHKGYTVFPETYKPQIEDLRGTPGLPHSPNFSGTVDTDNVNSRPYIDNDFELTEEDDDFNFDVPVPTNNALKTNKPANTSSKEKTSNLDICPTCTTGVIEAIPKSTDISFSISRGTVRVTNKAKTKMIGSFALSYCPTCGEKL